jgi:hypothetical protein
MMLTFLYGRPSFEKEKWQWIAGYLRVRDLLLWMPHPRQMGWRFDDPTHSLEDWNEGSLSALWDIESGTVVYAPGLHDRKSIRKEGVSLDELLGIW